VVSHVGWAFCYGRFFRDALISLFPRFPRDFFLVCVYVCVGICWMLSWRGVCWIVDQYLFEFECLLLGRSVSWFCVLIL
jgi:hypothetical protein